jgi:hypothetical protein
MTPREVFDPPTPPDSWDRKDSPLSLLDTDPGNLGNVPRLNPLLLTAISLYGYRSNYLPNFRRFLPIFCRSAVLLNVSSGSPHQ